MFDFWPVYSGERFRASWPSCYVMGKALSDGLSCPCDRSCFLSKQFHKSRSVLQDGSRFWDCFGRENPTTGNSQITITDLILILGIFEEKPRSYSKNEYGNTENEVSHSPVMQSSVGDKQNSGTFSDCTARVLIECYIIKPVQSLLMKHLVIGQR